MLLERHTLTLKNSYLTSLRVSPFHHFLFSWAQRLPYFLFLGVRLTVLGHSLEKYENSEKLCGGPTTAKNTTPLIVYRQVPPKTTETSKNLAFTAENYKNSNLEISVEFLFLLHFVTSIQKPLSKDYQNIPFFAKEYCEEL